MNTFDISQLPEKLQERLTMREHSKLAGGIVNKYSLNETQTKSLIALEVEFLQKGSDLSSLSVMMAQKLGLDASVAEKITLELLQGFYYLFQDYIGSISELIVRLGGNLDECKARTRTLLGPARQVQDMLKSHMARLSIPEQFQKKYLEIITAYFADKNTEVLRTKLGGFFSSTSIQVSSLENIMKDVAEFAGRKDIPYYLNLADTVINATPFKDPAESSSNDESGKEGDESFNRQTISVVPVIPAVDAKIDLTRRFNELSEGVRNRFTAPDLIAKRQVLEQKYSVKLESVMQKSALKDFPLYDLAIILKKECNLIPETASALKDEMLVMIFASLTDYFQPAKSQPMVNTPPGASMGIPLVSAEPTQRVSSEQSQNTASIQAPGRDAYQTAVFEALKKSGVSVSAELYSRVEKILVSRLRNVRNSVETREKLMEPLESAGVGCSAVDADALLREIEISAQRFHDPASLPSVKAPAVLQSEDMVQQGDDWKLEARETSSVQPAPSQPQSPPRLAIEEVDGVPTFVERKEGDISTPQPPVVRQVPAQRASSPVRPSRPDTHSGPQPIKVIVEQTSTSAARPSFRPSLSDVRSTKLVDGIEELRILSLKDFRRLSPDPTDAIKRIYQKILAFEKESMTKKVAAIDAWKESEVNRLYVQMGQESFGSGKSMTQVNEARTAAGQPVLTEQEFDALLDLNEMLRF